MVWLYTMEVKYTDDTLKKLVAPLGPQEKQHVYRYKRMEDQINSAAGMYLIKTALQEQYNQNDISINVHPGVKPYANWNGDFNVSHTHGMVVCAASDTCAVGVDVELIDPIAKEVMSEVLSPYELDQVVHTCGDDEESWTMFYQLWTLKEAYLKANGLGLPNQELTKLQFELKIPIQLYVNEQAINDHSFWTCIDGGEYAISACLKSKNTAPRINRKHIMLH